MSDLWCLKPCNYDGNMWKLLFTNRKFGAAAVCDIVSYFSVRHHRIFCSFSCAMRSGFAFVKADFVHRWMSRLWQSVLWHFEEHKIFNRGLTCFTALLIYRILEAKLEDQKMPITIEKLIQTLKNINVVNIHDFHYMALYDNSYTLKALEKNFSLLLDRKYYRPKELNKLCKKLSK